MFINLTERVVGKDIENCVLKMHQTRTELYDILDKVKAREAIIGPAKRDKDSVLQGLYSSLNEARVNYAAAEATLERVKAEHTGIVSLTNLLTAYVQAGKDTSELEKAICTLLGETSKDDGNNAETNSCKNTVKQDENPKEQEDENETGEFTVLEARLGKSPGTVRAYCEASDGNKYAIFAKNGNGKKLSTAIGKTIRAKYIQGDKGLIAFEVEVLN